MKEYISLFKLFKDQPTEQVFAHFYPAKRPGNVLDFDAPFKDIAKQSFDGYDSWAFQQERFRQKYNSSEVPKLRNYLNYTFVRLVTLEQESPGQYFQFAQKDEWIRFNTGLQNSFGADILAIFQRYKEKEGYSPDLRPRPDWVYKGFRTPTDKWCRDLFGGKAPEIAWYSKDSRDFVFDTSYQLDKEAFDHLFERAKERAGLPGAQDEVVRNYLRGAIENLVPKITRNYKVAIPVYYVEERRMQLLLPFLPATGDPNNCSSFLVERDDEQRCYRLKTIFDLDQAYFSARLITRPDKDWLNP